MKLVVSSHLKTPFCPPSFPSSAHGIVQLSNPSPSHIHATPSPNSAFQMPTITVSTPIGKSSRNCNTRRKVSVSRSLAHIFSKTRRRHEARTCWKRNLGQGEGGIDIPYPSPQSAVAIGRRRLRAPGSWGTLCSIGGAVILEKERKMVS